MDKFWLSKLFVSTFLFVKNLICQKFFHQHFFFVKSLFVKTFVSILFFNLFDKTFFYHFCSAKYIKTCFHQNFIFQNFCINVFSFLKNLFGKNFIIIFVWQKFKLIFYFIQNLYFIKHFIYGKILIVKTFCINIFVRKKFICYNFYHHHLFFGRNLFIKTFFSAKIFRLVTGLLLCNLWSIGTIDVWWGNFRYDCRNESW